MALTPEARPAWQSWGNLRPAADIVPQVGIYYDSAGNPHQNYMAAPAPGAVAASGAIAGSFRAITTSDSVALPAGVQGLRFATAQTTLSVKGINDTVAVALGPQAAGTTLVGQFSFVMATGTSPGTGIVAII